MEVLRVYLWNIVTHLLEIVKWCDVTIPTYTVTPNTINIAID